MANYNKKISDTLIRIGEVRFSYVHVFAPRADDDGKPGKYGVCIVWPKSDTQTTELVKSAINAAKELAKEKGIKLPANCKTPLRDGDIDREEDENFSGCYGAATVNFFPYDSSGNKGIGAGLNNLIKTRDGEKLSGGTSAESDFGDLGSLDCLNLGRGEHT